MNHLKWLGLYAFQRAITPYDPCGDDPAAFVPESTCLQEGSRIIGAFLANVSVNLESLTDATALTAAITAEDIYPLKDLAGSWPLATSNKKPGKGYTRERHSSFTFAIPFSHFSVDANLAFWNTVAHQRNWSMLFVFEDLAIYGALTKDKKLIPMDIPASVVSDGELGNQREIQGTASWTGQQPYKLNSTVVGAFTNAILAGYFQG